MADRIAWRVHRSWREPTLTGGLADYGETMTFDSAIEAQKFEHRSRRDRGWAPQAATDVDVSEPFEIHLATAIAAPNHRPQEAR